MSRKNDGIEALADVLQNLDGTPVDDTDEIFNTFDSGEPDEEDDVPSVSYDDTAIVSDEEEPELVGADIGLEQQMDNLVQIAQQDPVRAFTLLSQSRVEQEGTKVALEKFEFLPPEWLRDAVIHTCNQYKLNADGRHGANRYKFSRSQDLEPWQCAEIMLRKFRCVKIDYGKSQNSHKKSKRSQKAHLKTCSAAIYDEEDGIYYTDSDYIKGIVCELYPEANDPYVTKVCSHLLMNAPRVRLTGFKAGEEWLVPVNNGIFNFKTKELYDFDPKYVFTWKIDVDYNKNAIDAPIMMPNGKEFTVEWMLRDMMADNDDDLRCLKQSLMSLMLPWMPWDMAIFFYSKTGASGKGTLAKFVESCFGDAAINKDLQQMEKQFGLGELLTSGAVCIISHENNVGSFNGESANFKALTTHDSTSVEAKYKDSVSATFHVTMLHCLNELPRVKDKTDSYWRRYFPIPFPRCYKTEGDIEEIKNDYLEREEVKEYFLKMLLELEPFKTLEPSEHVKELLVDIQEVNDPMPRFVDECLHAVNEKGEIVAYPNVSKLPLEWVYFVYKGWHKAKIPSGAPVSYSNFKESFLKALGDDDCWSFDENVMAVSKKYNNELRANRWMHVEMFDVKELENVRYLNDGGSGKTVCPEMQKAMRGFLKNKKKEDDKEEV